MRKPAKSSLRNYILKNADGNMTSSCVSCVIDGGAMLHKVKWSIGNTFKDVIISYQDYIQARFDRYHNLYIVFDGYDDDKLSINATEHKRRSSLFLCLIVGGGEVKFWGKNPSSSFNYYKKMT